MRVLCREMEGRDARRPRPLAELRAGATGLFRALAGLRDLDILQRELRELGGAGALPGPLPRELGDWSELERQRLRSGLPDAVSFFADEVRRFRGRRPTAPPRLAAGSRELARRAHRFLLQLEKARGDPRAEVLHRLRIRGKQLRYAAEGTTPQPSAGPLESGLKRLQDALGAVQDAAMAVARLDALAAGATLSPAVAGPARVAAANERDRRRRAFLDELAAGGYDNLLIEVRQVAARQGHAGGEDPEAEARQESVPLEEIPGIGAAKARRLAEAGLATPQALRAATVEELAAVKTIGAHQARLIKDYVEGEGARTNGPGPASGAADDGEPDGKRFERAQSVLSVSAVVADYARTLAEDLSRHEAGDAIRAGRQAERIGELLSELPERVEAISTKRLKGLRGELRETEGLLAKVLDLDSGSLKMNKLRKALKAHRKAIASFLEH